MPLYQQIILAVPKCSSAALTKVFRNHAKVIFENNGNLRGIENHGIKPLSERTKKKWATKDGTRHFWETKFISVIFDGSPQCVFETERFLRTENEAVIRFMTTRLESAVERVTGQNYRNPYFRVEDIQPPRGPDSW